MNKEDVIKNQCKIDSVGVASMIDKVQENRLR